MTSILLPDESDAALGMKTYHVEDGQNQTSTVVKIYNEMESDDATALGAFFIFMLLLLLLAVLFYYSSSLRLFVRQSVVFPLRRLCCEGEQKRLWLLHKDAVIRGDAARQAAAEGGALAQDDGGSTSPLDRRVELAGGSTSASVVADSTLLDGVERGVRDPLEVQLDSLVGLEPLKEEIRALRRTLVVEQQRRRMLDVGGRQTKMTPTSAPHLVFQGSPGTGKTHAARLIAQLLKELGYVHGDIVEVQRADLVAGYVGQTALKTRAVINRAKGGVLFVDEAYALTPGRAGERSTDFGTEAVQELMRDLTSGDPIVILAGYPEEMSRFLASNPGLSRRFQVRFNFPDYSLSQLAAIFAKIAKRNGFRLARDASPAQLEQVLLDYFTPAICRKWNGGLPEGLFRRAQDALAKRLNVLTMSADIAFTLSKDDVIAGARILAATLGETPSARRSQPRRAATRAPAATATATAHPSHDVEAGESEDDDVYGDVPASRRATPPTASPLDALLSSLGTDSGALGLGGLSALPQRVDALENAVTRLALAVATAHRAQPQIAQPNPWAQPPTAE